MSHDHNNERDERLRNVPAPRFRRDPEFERMDFEDQAIDSSLHTMAKSKDDGEEFLQRVKSRLGCSTEEIAPVGEETNGSFFGVAAPSLKELAAPQTKVVNSETKPSRKFHYAAVFTAASLLVGLVAWKTMSTDSPATPSHQIAVIEKAGENPEPFVTPREVNKVEVANHEPEKVANDISTVEIDKHTPSTPEVASTTSARSAETSAAVLEPFWHLRFEFDESNTATAWIRGHKLCSEISVRNMEGGLKSVCHEVAKHVHYFSPILDTPWQGKLTISGTDFRLEEHFTGIDEMVKAGLELRKSFRELVSNSATLQPKLTDMQKNVRQLGFLIVSEETNRKNSLNDQLTKNALLVTDKLLKPEFDLTSFKKSDSVLYQNFAQLVKTDILVHSLEEHGELVRDPDERFQFIATFQNKDSRQLKLELEQAPQFDMFDSNEEFRSWIDQVASVTDLGSMVSQQQDLKDRIRELHVQDRSQTQKRELARVGQQIAALQQRIQEKKQAGKGNKRRRKPIAPPQPIAPLLSMLPQKPELKGFDLAMGDACHLSDHDAKTLDRVSSSFGAVLQRIDPFGARKSDPRNVARNDMLKRMIRTGLFLLSDNPDQAMGTIDQMLQIENAQVRIELIKALGQLDSPSACKLLACYAKYDVDENVRYVATDVLRSFPPEVTREELLDGFRYPWPEVAAHSAEAIVLLNDTESIPQLIELLKKPDPREPEKLENGDFVHREMVAINHLRNCMLCHLDSHEAFDRGRGVIPYRSRKLSQDYYANKLVEIPTVRADVTYLRQDFSVLRKVKDPGPWPRKQRFDYVARNKSISSAEAVQLSRKLSSQPNEYKNAIVTALQLLTGKKPADNSWKAWNAAVKEM